MNSRKHSNSQGSGVGGKIGRGWLVLRTWGGKWKVIFRGHTPPKERPEQGAIHKGETVKIMLKEIEGESRKKEPWPKGNESDKKTAGQGKRTRKALRTKGRGGVKVRTKRDKKKRVRSKKGLEAPGRRRTV